MSSANIHKNRTGAAVIGVVVLVVLYLLIPPVIVSLLAYGYGDVYRIPANVSKIYAVLFAPADWLAHNSHTYDAVLMYEMRLLGLQ